MYVVSPLAGAYRGKQNERRMVSHACFDMSHVTRAFCGYDRDDLGDVYGAEPQGTLPTCSKCLAKFEKYASGQTTRFPKGAGP